MTAKEKMEKSRSQFVLRERFFATILMSLGSKEDTTCKTLWTDGKQIGYNPDFILALTEERLMFGIIHELFHVTNRHHLRRGNREKKLWNKACDYCINPVIVRLGFKAIEDILLDDRFNDLSPEAIYAILLTEQNQKKKEEESNDQQNKGGDQKNVQENTSPVPDQRDGEKTPEDSGDKRMDDARDKLATPDENNESDSAGKETKGEEKMAAPDTENQPEEKSSDIEDYGCGEIRDMKNEDGSEMSDAEKSSAEVKTKITIAQAARIANQAGQISAGMQRVIGELQAPSQNWRAELMAYLTQYAKNEYNWNTPNRRYIHTGMYLPSRKGQDLGKVILALDSSGSIDQKLWTTFIGEMKSLMEMFDLTLTVIVADNQIQSVTEDITADEICQIKIKGFGGTDFKPAFEWVEKNGIDPNLLLYFTDLECNSFPVDPMYPVVWCSWGRDKAPFGHVIKVK